MQNGKRTECYLFQKYGARRCPVGRGLNSSDKMTSMLEGREIRKLILYPFLFENKCSHHTSQRKKKIKKNPHTDSKCS